MKRGALLLLMAACNGSAVPDAGVTAAARWVPVRPGEEEGSTLEGPARVLPGPAAVSVVTPPLRATIMKLRVREGDVVDAGEPLVDVVMPELLDAAGRHEGARERLAAWSARHRQLGELRSEGLARSSEVSEAGARAAEARADLQAARAVLLAAGVREAEVPGLLSGTGAIGLKAPVAGLVTHVAVTLGESREPNGGPLVFLASGGPVRLEARFAKPAPEGQFEYVGAGVRVPLRMLSRAPMADPKDGSFLAWFEPTSDVALAAGTLGRVRLERGGSPTVFWVPAVAVTRADGGTGLVTRRGPVSVEVRRCDGEDCLVRGELQPDDVVAARPP